MKELGDEWLAAVDLHKTIHLRIDERISAFATIHEPMQRR